jgi:hypothetical protein
MTTLREKVIKIGANVVSNARYIIFQTAEVAVSRGFVRCHPQEDREAQAAREAVRITGKP